MIDLQLKPCPFCGGTQAGDVSMVRSCDPHEAHRVVCWGCGIDGPGTNKGEDVAALLWNQRPKPPETS